jgi:asparagine synthase (glutamine-hydrolysing)
MFCILVASTQFILNRVFPSSQYQHLQSDGRLLTVVSSFKPKTVDDSFIEIDNGGFTLFEGIAVSRKTQKDCQSALSMKSHLLDVLKKNNENELASLHGQFACMNYSQSKQELNVYNNVSNSFRVYYYHQDGILIVASSIKIIVTLLQANNISYSVDEIGIRMMLSYGYMIRDWTTISEIRQFGSAGKINYVGDRLKRSAYFRFDTSIKYSDKRKIAFDLKEMFSEVVRTSFERDEKQRHFAFISGGLDSRLVVWTAHELGYEQVDCLNFSQPGYLDQTIATQICHRLGFNMTFFSLGGGEYLKNLDDNLKYHEGQIVLHGAAHLYSSIKTMDMQKYGIMHSGQIGDILKGSYLQRSEHSAVNMFAAAYSSKILGTIAPYLQKYKQEYATHEQFVLENRGFNGMTNGDLACLDFGYSPSPFLDPNFMQYCLNIDPELRARAMMYLYWMRHSYPEASRFRWEKYNCPVKTPYLLARLRYNMWRGSDKIIRMITKKPNTLNMNPFDYWWNTNPSLRQHYSDKFTIPEYLRSHFNRELTEAIETMLSSNSLSEKLQAYCAVRSTSYYYETESLYVQ